MKLFFADSARRRASVAWMAGTSQDKPGHDGTRFLAGGGLENGAPSANAPRPDASTIIGYYDSILMQQSKHNSTYLARLNIPTH